MTSEVKDVLEAVTALHYKTREIGGVCDSTTKQRPTSQRGQKNVEAVTALHRKS